MTGGDRLRGWLPLGVVVLLAGFARFWQLDAASLWLDEAATVKFATLPWSTLWLSGYDNAPPLHYSLVKLCLNLGAGELSVRLPSAVFGTLSVAAVYLAGHLIGGRTAGLAAALFTALSATHIEYSQEARGYAVLGLFVTLALAGLLMTMRTGTAAGTTERTPATARASERRGVVLYAFGILGALYTHNVAVFFVLVTQLAFGLHWLFWSRRDRGLVIHWMLANTAVFVLWLPWVFIVLGELIGNGTMAWLEHTEIDAAFRIWRRVHAFAYVWRAQPWIDVAVLLAALYGVWRLRQRPGIPTALVLVAAGGPLAVWLSGWLQPLYLERTVAWSFPGTALLLGAAAAGVSGRGRWLVLAALGIVAARSVLSFFALGEAENENWRHVPANATAAMHRDGDGLGVLFCAPAVVLPYVYYAAPQDPLPPLYAWGLAAQGFAATPLATGGDSRLGRLGGLPNDLFRWQRGAVDQGRRPLPAWRDRGPDGERWTTLGVVDSHCPDDAREALGLALDARGWVVERRYDFDGGQLRIHTCRRDAGECRLP